MKNYTSSVPVGTTLSRIEQTLAKAGACDVLKEYEGGEIIAVSFSIRNPTDSSRKLLIRLPANAQAVANAFRKGMKRPRRDSFARVEDQARRTAWKIIQDWIEIQISLIEMGQADFIQVFLPYICVQGNKTFYNQLREGGFKLLGTGRDMKGE